MNCKQLSEMNRIWESNIDNVGNKYSWRQFTHSMDDEYNTLYSGSSHDARQPQSFFIELIFPWKFEIFYNSLKNSHMNMWINDWHNKNSKPKLKIKNRFTEIICQAPYTVNVTGFRIFWVLWHQMMRTIT